ncbi:MAG: hypothetical protein A2X04_06170 [Bacteroidetes bacterium GWF2_41_9]|nr:MAG: hypothetical protein A2X03_11510 [Bacteroidetes bacterium GWA2_40_15]OFX92571.1 MAG: hypothetical protein A2X06_17840 [Bacteroidetes bacterium GWC2_40_22]OFY60722.1 MAG: hypothetical protein A2X04_06170 [Bacteroidetes bacterium GWF2_41_9]HAM11313.1 hypothetical protein [Bacteroidales bacterium]HBQ81786.1 hypothetical protein [Bacteroidales bacterium]
MKHFTKVLIAFCLFGYGTTIQAQYSIAAAGGNAGAAFTVSYTVGQVLYSTIGATETINQGVQGPYEISVVTVIAEESVITIEASVYPNPATGFVTLKIESYEPDNLSYRLYDMNGMLFQSDKLKGNETLIQMGSIKSGTYLLKIADNNKELKTFKIIKK